MNENESHLPLGLCKQAAMKLDAFISDVHEIMEDEEITDADRQDFRVMVDLANNIMAHLINTVNREVPEAEFLSEEVPMDDIDPYPEAEDDTDVLDMANE
jgi:hypothetical protein